MGQRLLPRAQLKAPAKEFQLCLAHQLRDLDRVIEIFPEAILGQSSGKSFRAIQFCAQPIPPERADDDRRLWLRRVFQLESELDELLSRPVHNPGARNLKERF